ncbi:helix-turn-helix domain-containing protein [Arenimonas sp.]|uniref:helix-turn-helix domain-containing protein n=1 Tax=Arenimonas sp. TaxID=1872635 RepID=UPI0025BE19F9|nr:helix-turn-helix domain-containing protein [Arenimonas sp.]
MNLTKDLPPPRRRSEEDRGAIDRALDALEALSGASPDGLRPRELAQAANVTDSWVSVTLPRLAERGWVERTDMGAWRLGRKFADIAAVELAQLGKAARRVDELQQRWTRGVA